MQMENGFPWIQLIVIWCARFKTHHFTPGCTRPHSACKEVIVDVKLLPASSQADNFTDFVQKV